MQNEQCVYILSRSSGSHSQFVLMSQKDHPGMAEDWLLHQASPTCGESRCEEQVDVVPANSSSD